MAPVLMMNHINVFFCNCKEQAERLGAESPVSFIKTAHKLSKKKNVRKSLTELYRKGKQRISSVC